MRGGAPGHGGLAPSSGRDRRSSVDGKGEREREEEASRSPDLVAAAPEAISPVYQRWVTSSGAVKIRIGAITVLKAGLLPRAIWANPSRDHQAAVELTCACRVSEARDEEMHKLAMVLSQRCPQLQRTFGSLNLVDHCAVLLSLC